jgi:hypothetical protein
VRSTADETPSTGKDHTALTRAGPATTRRPRLGHILRCLSSLKYQSSDHTVLPIANAEDLTTITTGKKINQEQSSTSCSDAHGRNIEWQCASDILKLLVRINQSIKIVCAVVLTLLSLPRRCSGGWARLCDRVTRIGFN